MRANIIIRPCRIDECATILNIWKESGSTPSVTDNIEYLTSIVSNNNELFLVVESDGRLVGTVLGGWDGWRGNIYRLAVLPEYRKQGIGRALVLDLEQRLSDKGAVKISILIEHKDKLATSFWNSLKKNGYIPDLRIARITRDLST